MDEKVELSDLEFYGKLSKDLLQFAVTQFMALNLLMGDKHVFALGGQEELTEEQKGEWEKNSAAIQLAFKKGEAPIKMGRDLFTYAVSSFQILFLHMMQNQFPVNLSEEVVIEEKDHCRK
jgi:hypothetical protein